MVAGYGVNRAALHVPDDAGLPIEHIAWLPAEPFRKLAPLIEKQARVVYRLPPARILARRPFLAFEPGHCLGPMSRQPAVIFEERRALSEIRGEQRIIFNVLPCDSCESCDSLGNCRSCRNCRRLKCVF